jgi:60 kDa SS-A/Ro ribonucleoprotein
MVTARVEPYAEFVAFSHKMVPINIRATDSMDTILQKMQSIEMGATDCALPMAYAEKNGLLYDGFAIYTDNETWWGDSVRRWGQSHFWTNEAAGRSPMETLQAYRRSSGIHDAKLAVVGITATDFTIADPNDFNTLDFVGFDASAPALMADFFRG